MIKIYNDKKYYIVKRKDEKMEPLFKSNTKYNYEEYKKFNYAITSSINKMPVKIVVIMLLFILMAYMYMSRSIHVSLIMLICSIIFPVFLILTIKSNIKRTYSSNKSMQDMDVNFEFYDEYFMYKCKIGDSKIEYKDLYKILETKTNIYLMIAKNQGVILKKENCSEDLIDFIRKMK